MCGFTGLIHPNSISNPHHDALARAQTVSIYRGPDAQSIYTDNYISIAFNRLSINNLSSGHQPVRFRENGEARDSVLCFNGEIFNYKDLESRYLNPPFIRNEAEVLAALFSTLGIDMLSKLNGQFSIAIYSQSRKCLLLARDPFGIRPLFYSSKLDNAFLFASDLNSIWEFGIDKIFCNKQLARLHLTWSSGLESTIWKDIYQVKPGTVRTFSLGHDTTLFSKEHTYWDWNQFIGDQGLQKRKLTAEDCAHFRYQFFSAVKRQSMSEVGIGCYLSGGIDSSVAAFALSRQQDSLKTYSVSFTNPDYDESEKQILLSNQIKSSHTSLSINESLIGNSFSDVSRFIQQPFFRTAPIPLYLLSQKVNYSGQKVIMTGEGADEILFGYDIFREQACVDFIQQNMQSKWRHKSADSLYSYLPQYKNPRYRALALQTLMRKGTYSVLNPLKSRLSNNLRSLSVADASEASYAIDALLQEYESDSAFSDLDDLAKIQKYEIDNLLSGYLLSSQGDRVAMANSVEGRYPFLDLDFVKYVNHLPRDWKLKGNFFKRILRESFRDYIPSNIVDAPKIAYQAPEARAILSNSDILDMLLDKDNAIYSFYSYSKISKIVARVLSSRAGSRGGFTDNMVTCIAASLSVLIYDR